MGGLKLNKDVPEPNVKITRITSINETDLFVKPSSLRCVNENPEIMIARVYNKLPICIKNIEKYDSFVKALKTVLLERNFYDMHEYWSCQF
jgi:hypothetical protein